MPYLELTFDDGPDPAWTPRVLEALAEARLAASFFVIAPRAAAHPGLVAAIRDGGHAVELHCHDHVRPTCQSAAEQESDVRAALGVLAPLGVRPRRWRTPWGLTMRWTPALARTHGLVLTGWTADSHDWRGDRAPDMLRGLRDRLAEGAILLLHDGMGPGGQRATAAETVALVRLLGRELAARGLHAGVPEAVAPAAPAGAPPRGGSGPVPDAPDLLAAPDAPTPPAPMTAPDAPWVPSAPR